MGIWLLLMAVVHTTEKNDQTIRAIVRFSHEGSRLVAGDLVTTSLLSFTSTLGPEPPFVQIAVDTEIGWVPRWLVLPLHQYLCRKPVGWFWVLAKSKRLLFGKPNPFLSKPDTRQYGEIPFRFESPGELTYYVKNNRIPFGSHSVMESSRFSDLLNNVQSKAI